MSKIENNCMGYNGQGWDIMGRDGILPHFFVVSVDYVILTEVMISK
jgi:hypothetical protein